MATIDHTFVVTVSGCTPEQARQVIAERINHDEDYGFEYSIGYEEKAPVTPGYAITLDAESVKAEMQDRFDNSGDPELTEDDLNTVLAASDERVSQLINNFVDDSFWSEYDDVRSRVISQLLAEAP